MDTIFAEATPPGRGGVSMIRISGPEARAVTEGMVGPLPQARRAYLRDLRDGTEVVDQALCLRFDRGASFTGEALVEVHLHGAPVIVRRVQAMLAAAGLRPAEAGEFTRRAFLNGRIDLIEAEGLADLLEAETEAQRRQAMVGARGDLGRAADGWREALVRAGALVEVSVDFADEEVPEEVPPEAFDLIAGLRASLVGALAGYPAAERVRAGFEVAVIGPPNAGKSSLMNRIARREVALVSPVAGTTRDVIELRVDLRGLAVTFLDTAGLRDTGDAVEAMGVARARDRAAAADLRLHLSEDGTVDADLWRPGDLAVRTKADLDAGGEVSAATGAGVGDLLDRIHALLADRVAGAGLVSRDRQAAAIGRALAALEDVDGLPPEIVAERLRQAAADLDALVGRIGAEDYLDRIFSAFCIGK